MLDKLKKLSYVLPIVFFIVGLPCEAKPRRDYQLHTAYSFVISFGSSLYFKDSGFSNLQSAFLGSVLSFAVGYSKEALYDDFIDSKDLEANAIGSMAGAFISIPF